MLNIIDDHNLQQNNNIPTRGNNILDLVFTTNNNLIEHISIQDGISDHQAVLVTIKTKVKTVKKKQRKIFIYSKGNMPKLKEQLRTKLSTFIRDNNNTGIETCWESFKDLPTSLMTEHIPQKKLL